HLYRRWLTEQEAAFTQVSPSVQEALASGRGRVRICSRAARLRASLPVGDPAPSASAPTSKRRREGGRDSAHGKPFPQPCSLTRLPFTIGSLARRVVRASDDGDAVCCNDLRERVPRQIERRSVPLQIAVPIRAEANPGRERPRLWSALQPRPRPGGRS